MSKVVTKLFREAAAAEDAVSKLKAQGYREEEIGILMREGPEGKRFAVDNKLMAKGTLPPAAGSIIAMGATAAVTSANADLGTALAGFLDLSKEAFDYYKLGISLGGIVVSVHADETRAAEARKLMRAVGAKSLAERSSVAASSPGFVTASRMSETNPLDAKMTGDFRKY